MNIFRKKNFHFLCSPVEPKIRQTRYTLTNHSVERRGGGLFDDRSCSFLFKTFQWLFNSSQSKIQLPYTLKTPVICFLPTSPASSKATCPGFLRSRHTGHPSTSPTVCSSHLCLCSGCFLYASLLPTGKPLESLKPARNMI